MQYHHGKQDLKALVYSIPLFMSGTWNESAGKHWVIIVTLPLILPRVRFGYFVFFRVALEKPSTGWPFVQTLAYWPGLSARTDWPPLLWRLRLKTKCEGPGSSFFQPLVLKALRMSNGSLTAQSCVQFLQSRNKNQSQVNCSTAAGPDSERRTKLSQLGVLQSYLQEVQNILLWQLVWDLNWSSVGWSLKCVIVSSNIFFSFHY